MQEAILRAFRRYETYDGGNARAWLLAIVRNICLTAIERRRSENKVIILGDIVHEREQQRVEAQPDPAPLQDAQMLAAEDQRRVHAAIATLPTQFREVLVLREFHELNYRDIAEIVGTPVGTVMSRLARAREKLKAALSGSDLSGSVDMTETGQKQ